MCDVFDLGRSSYIVFFSYQFDEYADDYADEYL